MFVENNGVKLVIPPRKFMRQTNVEDPIYFHYYPFVGVVYRRRLQNTLSLMQSYRFNKLLEVGYGSGIFFPSLSQLAEKVVAIDTHKETGIMKDILDQLKLDNVEVLSADVRKMPFAKNTFDACAIVSTLENIKRSEKVVGELKRVVKPKGHFFLYRFL